MHRALARGGLLVALASCTGSATTARRSAPRQEAPAATSRVTFEELAPSVWMHTSVKDIAPWGPVVTHGLVVTVGETSILVDTAWDDPQTEQVLDWAATTLGRPVRRAVLTHAHADKMGGVGTLRLRDVATYALARSNELAPLRDLAPAEHALAIDDEGLSADLAPLVVFHPGAGHTEDNLVVWVPAAKLLFGGCLIRPGDAADLGNTADADVDAWDDSVRRVKERFATVTTIVPSHGDPGGPELLDHTIELVAAQEAVTTD